MRNLVYILILFLFSSGKPGSNKVIISEFMASNKSFLTDNNGICNDWLELNNYSKKTINLNGFFLSDDDSNLQKHQINNIEIPPHGQYLFWASGNKSIENHLNFKLDKKGGVIILTSPDGKTIISKITYQQQIDNYSLMWINDDWYYSNTPTPGFTNKSDKLYSLDELLNIKFDYYDGKVEVTILQTKNRPIKYTTDGSSPLTGNFHIYNGAFIINTPCIIRAVEFGDEIISINESFKAYNDPTKHSLPVISLVTDPINLWDSEIGIYVKGNHINYNKRAKEWQRNGKFEFFRKGQLIAEENISFKIFGSGTRKIAKKSLTLLANSNMKNHYFTSTNADFIDGFVLRACYSDISKYQNELVKHVNDQMGGNALMQEYQPVVLYLNGNYWGVFNLTERKNKTFIKRHVHIKPKDIINANFYRSKTIMGSNKDYQNLIDTLNSLSINEPSTYEYIISKFDINSLLDFWVQEIYTNKLDRFNNRIWKPKGDFAKWKYITYDFDISFIRPENLQFLKESKDTTAVGVNIIGRLLLNDEFKSVLFERLCDFLNFGYTEANVSQLLNRIDIKTREEFKSDYTRWKAEIPRYEQNSEKQKKKILDFVHLRSKYLRTIVFPMFGFSEQVNISNGSPGKGSIYVNGYLVNDEVIYFTKMDLDIQVQANPGFEFIGWTDPEIKISSSGKITFDKSGKVEPIFIER